MKLFVTSKDNLIIYFLIIVLLSGLVIFNHDAVAEVFENASPKRDLPIYCVDKGEEKICSISFDAAWGNEDTAELISILEKYNVKATFFVVGAWVDKYPESVKQLHDAGHEIMNHSDSHPHMTKLDADGIKKEINSCSDKIEAITGVRPTLFRPPYGDYNDRVVASARDINHYTIQWDVETLATLGNRYYISDFGDKKYKIGFSSCHTRVQKCTPVFYYFLLFLNGFLIPRLTR